MQDQADIVRKMTSNKKIIVETKDFNEVLKDRLDFGFDSIYFRYAELCDELAIYKAKVNRTDPEREYKDMNWRKMHFYEALEQLVHAHPSREEIK